MMGDSQTRVVRGQVRGSERMGVGLECGRSRLEDNTGRRYGGSGVRATPGGIHSHVHRTGDGLQDMQVEGWRQLEYETESPNGGNWEFSI